MSTVVLTIAGCWYPTPLFSQLQEYEAAYADSLLHLAWQATSDSAKIEHYFALSNFWSERDTAKAYGYIETAKKYMHPRTDYHKGLIHFYTANIIYSSDIERAKREYLLADQWLREYHSPLANRYKSRLWNNYGTLLQRQDRADVFLDIIIQKALPFSRMAGDSILVANDLHNIGLLLMNIADYESAGKYYLQAMQTLSNYPQAHEDKLTVFVNAAKNAVYSREYPEARRYLDSAAAQITMIPHSLYAPVYYRTEGNYYRHVQQKDRALQNFEKGLLLAKDMGDAWSLYDINFELYALYRDFGEYPLAKNHLIKAYEHAYAITNEHDVILAMREMADIEYKLANYRSAYEWMKQYALKKDTLFENNQALQILELEKKFKTIEHENEILQLQDFNQKQQLTIERNKRWVIVLVAVLLLSLMLAYFVWKLVRNNKKLYQEELKSLKQEEEIKIYNSMLQGQELERKRIARDLHDGLGGMLAGVKLKLSSIASKEKSTLGTTNLEVVDLIKQVDGSVDELRRVARNMMPEALLYMGLKPALEDLCKFLDSPSVEVKCVAIALRNNYLQSLSIAVYRVAQELLTNAIRHAKAKQIILQCSEREDRLFLTVEDNGLGFDKKAVLGNGGLGLSNIENRVSLLKGTLEVDSKPGKGTSIHIEIPLYER